MTAEQTLFRVLEAIDLFLTGEIGQEDLCDVAEQAWAAFTDAPKGAS